MPRELGTRIVARNRRARHDYTLGDVYEAGLVLTGTEVKSLRAGRASLIDGYASIELGEAWLDGVQIPEYAQGTWSNHTPRRRRKLLLHKKQIQTLRKAVNEGGFTIVPLSLYFAGGHAKVELAVAKGKRDFEKRRAQWDREDARDADRALSAHRRRSDGLTPLH
ncbi:SsrA-binding protein SmpB [Frigoribacterium sp. R86507]|uniref:SsrA-binding protein SmpB n=1 Tax=Frigoribacterium sp. R86507 TaxID=3093850 RepID=UPI0037CC48F5